MDFSLILTIGIAVIAYCFGFGVMAVANEKIFGVDCGYPLSPPGIKAILMAFFWPITLLFIVCIMLPSYFGAWLTDKLTN